MIRTHAFNGLRHKIVHVSAIDGVCDRPDLDGVPVVMVLDGKDLRTLHSQLHEAMEASHCCDKCLHDGSGDSRLWDAAKFIWREGWRRK